MSHNTLSNMADFPAFVGFKMNIKNISIHFKVAEIQWLYMRSE